AATLRPASQSEVTTKPQSAPQTVSVTKTSSRFTVRWSGGPSTSLEVGGGLRETVTVKYTPAFRAILRHPAAKLHNSAPAPSQDSLNDLVQATSRARSRNVVTVSTPGAAAHSASRKIADLPRVVGKRLFDILPRKIQGELRSRGLFLELGLDEGLLGYPWELMHDGEEYCCLKHFVGRLVNTSLPTGLPQRTPDNWTKPLEQLRVLLVSVPEPDPRESRRYTNLNAVREEAKAVKSILKEIPGCEVVEVTQPSYDNTEAAFDGSNRYHIVHFCGHGAFDGGGQSQLILQDTDLSAYWLGR